MIHVVFIVFWKETVFPLWRAMDGCWNRNYYYLLILIHGNLHNDHYIPHRRCRYIVIIVIGFEA